MRYGLVGILGALAACGCMLAPGPAERLGPGAQGPSAKNSSPAASSAGAAPLTAGLLPALTPASPPGVPHATTAAISLSGTVSVPASVLSNIGGGLISKTKPYHLLNLEQVPVAGAWVRCLNAAGKAILSPDGQPLQAQTDATGGYAFTVNLPAQSLVLSVSLPDGEGTLQALVPRTNSGRGRADIELISTLTTTYIVDRFVQSQADPVVALDKLPTEVEVQTREQAAKALEVVPDALPRRLAAPEVVQAVTTLRDKVPALDAQLETVRKLLIVAGLSELGDGQAAANVYVGRILDVLAAPDGSVFFHTWDGVIWRVTAQQTLQRISGVGAEVYEPEDGQDIANVRLGRLNQLNLDAQGRLWLLTSFGGTPLWRLSPDHRTLQKIAEPGTATFRWFVPTTGDQAVAYAEGALWEVAPGQPNTLLRRFSADERKLVDAASSQVGRDTQGQLYLFAWSEDMTAQRIYRLDPRGGELALLREVPAPVYSSSLETGKTGFVGQSLGLDRAGRIYVSDGQNLRVTTPEGGEIVLNGVNPRRWNNNTAMDMGPDGSIFVMDSPGLEDQQTIHRYGPTGRRLWAGKPPE